MSSPNTSEEEESVFVQTAMKRVATKKTSPIIESETSESEDEQLAINDSTSDDNVAAEEESIIVQMTKKRLATKKISAVIDSETSDSEDEQSVVNGSNSDDNVDAEEESVIVRTEKKGKGTKKTSAVIDSETESEDEQLAINDSNSDDSGDAEEESVIVQTAKKRLATKKTSAVIESETSESEDEQSVVNDSNSDDNVDAEEESVIVRTVKKGEATKKTSAVIDSETSASENEQLAINDSTSDDNVDADEDSITVKTAKKKVLTRKTPLVIDSETSESEDEQPVSNGSNSNHSINADESWFQTPRTNKDAKIINSDTSEEEKEHSSGVIPASDDDIENQDPNSFASKYTSRLSDNFGALQKDLCSTRLSMGVDENSDIVEVSSDEATTLVRSLPRKQHMSPKKQTTLKSFISRKDRSDEAENKIIKASVAENLVSKSAYDDQLRVVTTLEGDLTRVRDMLHTVDLGALPDKGKLLLARFQSIESSLKLAQLKLSKMVVCEDLNSLKSENKPVTWEDIKIESNTVQPKTLGQRALTTHNAQRTLTMERLEQLHGSLSSCPNEDTLAEDPNGLKVELMSHQKHALAWLMWRENQRPSGGILADDMGLGKTLTMISLMLKSKEEKPDRKGEGNKHRKEYEGGTLVICPASLLKQWEAEVNKHCRRGLASVELFHGPKREGHAKYLARHDMVVTTYSICSVEKEKTSSPLYRVTWRRIILDEGHQIRNYKSQGSIAVCALEGRSRWILTGTPIHNKEMDMYALMKFLRCSPFDDYTIWKQWIANKDTGGYQRLQTVIASLMLRRTKVQLQERGMLLSLPEKSWKLIEIDLDQAEKSIYEKVMLFSRSIFAQYLDQRANKNHEELSRRPGFTKNMDATNKYYKIYEKMVRVNRVKEVKQHEILLILLRLRQACCHPSLITQMLEREEFAEDEEIREINLLEELEKLNLQDGNVDQSMELDSRTGGKGVLNLDNPIFKEIHRSSKIGAVLKILKDDVLNKNEKAIVVSQWTSFLKLVGSHLRNEKIVFEQLDGTLNVDKRMQMVQDFNTPSHPTRVLLLSLTAGGVGLNLVGANHLLLIDVHWNPQLELQAQDRIYRVGQKKPVSIYKFITKDTIEERVKYLQDHKLAIADSMLTGSKQKHTQLSLQDLRMLFNM